MNRDTNFKQKIIHRQRASYNEAAFRSSSQLLQSKKLCIPMVRNANWKRVQNMKIQAVKSNALKELSNNSINNINTDKGFRLQLQDHLLLKSKAKTESLSFFNQLNARNNYIQSLKNQGKNLVQVQLLMSTLRTRASSVALRSSDFSHPSISKLSRNQEARSSCCGGRSSNSTTNLCSQSDSNQQRSQARSASNIPNSKQCDLGFSGLRLGIDQLSRAQKAQRSVKTGNAKSVRKNKNFVWNRKGKLRKIMDFFASFCENVSQNNKSLTFPESKKLDFSKFQNLRKWLKLSFTILTRDYELVYDQHTDNLANAALLYCAIKVEMSSTLFHKSLKPLAKRKKVTTKKIRASESYILLREILDRRQECQ